MLRCSLLARSGQHQQALDNHRPALDAYVRELGPVHAKTIRQRLWRASILVEMKRYDAANAAFEAALHDSSRVLGPNAPSTLLCMGRLAFGRLESGEAGAARKLLQERLELALANLGPTHDASFKAARDLIGLGRDLRDHKLVTATYRQFGAALTDAAAASPSPEVRAAMDRFKGWPDPTLPARLGSK